MSTRSPKCSRSRLRHRKRGEARHERLALAEHVSAPLDRADRRGERRRTADANPLELLDQRRLGVARGRRGFVPLRLEIQEADARLVAGDALADGERRQHRLLLFELRGRVVAAFDVRAAETGELDRLARRGEDRLLAVVRLRRDLDRRAQDARVHHLRRHRPLPDQFVDAQIVARRARLRATPAALVKFVGRIASCASCAFLTFVAYRRGAA